ncbi:MAG: ADP-ribosyltransferase, partial [Bdellovibrionales bacterium]|nr:ADP-ribosyltransferase [Bdellovibrionales bacterium]
MKKKIILTVFLAVLLFSTTSFAEDSCGGNCPSATTSDGMVKDVKDFSKKVQEITGVTPYFCRDVKVSTDQKEDLEFKRYVKNKSKSQKVNLSEYELKESVFSTLKYVAMKNIWAQTNDKTRSKIYYQEGCRSYPLNKLPEFVYERSVNKGALNESLVKSIRPICNAYKFSDLAPFLSKEVLSEAVLILIDAFPKSFSQIKNHLCQNFNDTPEIFLKGDDQTKALVPKIENEDQRKFREWFSSILTHDPVHYNFLLGDYLLIKLNDKFQFQQRKREDQVISFDQENKIYNYTNRDFTKINTCLRTGKCEEDSKEVGISMIASLEKLKMASGQKELTLFRGVMDPPKFLAKLLEENLDKETPFVFDKAFMSTTGMAKTAVGFGGTLGPDAWHLIVKAKSCVGID